MDLFDNLELETKKSRALEKEAKSAAKRMLMGPHTTLPDGIGNIWNKSLKTGTVIFKKDKYGRR